MATAKLQGEALVLDLLDGYLRSKALMTAYRLDVFSPVAEKPLTREQLLGARSLPARAGNILIDALVALGLLEENAGQLSLPAALGPVLDRRNKKFQATAFMIEHLEDHYPHLNKLADIIKSDGTSSEFGYWDYFKHEGAVDEVDAHKAEDYSRYMAETMKMIGATLLSAYDMTARKHLVDLFGGPGTFAQLALASAPQLRATLLEVPAVVQVAERAFATLPDLKSRFRAVATDVFKEKLPADADTFTMIRAAQNWDDERLVGLYARIAEALPSGGQLLVVERMLPEPFDPSAEPLYMRSLYLATQSPHSQFRKQSEHAALLKKGGFAEVEFRTSANAPYAFLKKGWGFAVATKR
jgi:demethylspheroidene O-methyltransferase